MPENEPVETSGWDSNAWSQKSRAITNLETRFGEFESLPHRQLCSADASLVGGSTGLPV